MYRVLNILYHKHRTRIQRMSYRVQSNISCMPIMYSYLIRCIYTIYSTFLCTEYEALMFGLKVHLIAHL